MDNVNAAKIIIRSLDLTSLNHNDTTETIIDLCKKAETNVGNTAAVCVYPEFISTAIKHAPQGTKIATVVNFPEGGTDLKSIEKEIKKAIKLGADEIDAVLPYRSLISGNEKICNEFLQMCRTACENKTLKIIIESGELKSTSLIKRATQMCINAKVDFVKTSTGKTQTSATPEAANAILETIKASGEKVGFKASGGIKTTEDAKKYLTLANTILGPTYATPSLFRIGASSVLSDLLKTIDQGY
ncbi:MAG: deoxyribose-phosphate aldolase [Alphaproteobacteria bacterium]|nr:deoxyribose-phosphate aldolase [Alphaproteobacteria bacterium]